MKPIQLPVKFEDKNADFDSQSVFRILFSVVIFVFCFATAVRLTGFFLQDELAKESSQQNLTREILTLFAFLIVFLNLAIYLSSKIMFRFFPSFPHFKISDDELEMISKSRQKQTFQNSDIKVIKENQNDWQIQLQGQTVTLPKSIQILDRSIGILIMPFVPGVGFTFMTNYQTQILNGKIIIVASQSGAVVSGRPRQGGINIKKDF